MLRSTRILMALVLSGLSIPDFGGTAQSRAVGLSLRRFVISGTVGVVGVRLEGLRDKSGYPVTTDENGRYLAQVVYGWTGTVRPVKEGYVFEPPSRTYPAVKKQCEDQDYTASLMTVTISGQAGAAGVRMQGLPGEPLTDEQGRYVAPVPYGWAGAIVPRKEGLRFTPEKRTYHSVRVNIIGEDYAVERRTVTISNVVRAGNEPIQGVTVIARPGGYAAVTDSQGRYNLKVPYGWSGSLGFHKSDFDIVGEVQYHNVTADITDRRFISPEDEWPPFPSDAPQGNVSVPLGRILVIPTTQMTSDAIAATTENLQATLHILGRESCGLQDLRGSFGAGCRASALYLQGAAAIFTVEMGLAPSPQTWAWMFEQYKDELLGCLRHAGGLCSIDPNEMVILTLIAPNGPAGQPVLSTTVLTMQVRKSDIDAFARGTLDFDQFRRKVKSFTY